jgi:hypothetical protein
LTPQSFIARNAGAPYQFGNGFCWFWPRATNTTTVASTAERPWEINWSGNAHQIKSFFAEPTPEQNLFFPAKTIRTVFCEKAFALFVEGKHLWW